MGFTAILMGQLLAVQRKILTVLLCVLQIILDFSLRIAVIFEPYTLSCSCRCQILDIDLDVWRRRGGDLTAGAGTVGNNKPGVGIEERNFSQNDESASHLAALRVQVTWHTNCFSALCPP